MLSFDYTGVDFAALISYWSRIDLVLICIERLSLGLTKRAVTQENWARAGLLGRVTFWMAIAAMISGVIFFMAFIGAVHNYMVPSGLH